PVSFSRLASRSPMVSRAGGRSPLIRSQWSAWRSTMRPAGAEPLSSAGATGARRAASSSLERRGSRGASAVCSLFIAGLLDDEAGELEVLDARAFLGDRGVLPEDPLHLGQGLLAQLLLVVPVGEGGQGLAAQEHEQVVADHGHVGLHLLQDLLVPGHELY